MLAQQTTRLLLRSRLKLMLLLLLLLLILLLLLLQLLSNSQFTLKFKAPQLRGFLFFRLLDIPF
jgi:hypothetical protein